MSLTITHHFEEIDYGYRLLAAIRVVGSRSSTPIIRFGYYMAIVPGMAEEQKELMIEKLDKRFQRYIGAA